MIIESGHYIWTKGEKVQLSQHFTTAEFTCHCTHNTCREQRLAVQLVLNLESLRKDVGPIDVTSGFRCHAHQDDLSSDPKVETVPPGSLSTHELGHAADIKSKDMRALLVNAPSYFKAIGIARMFLHVDLRTDKIRRWSYPGSYES